MSHFYGCISESARKTQPTARGHKSTGLTTWAAGWGGKIEVTLWEDGGIDHFSVWMKPHNGCGDRRLLVSGIVGESESVAGYLPQFDSAEAA